jgi:hypothetical protein
LVTQVNLKPFGCKAGRLILAAQMRRENLKRLGLNVVFVRAGGISFHRASQRRPHGDFEPEMVDVTGIEPVTPCLQSRTIVYNSSVRFL